MFSMYDRKKVSEVLFTKANLIHHAFAFGRKSQDVDDEFTLAFFLHCSEEHIKALNAIVDGKDEVLVTFSVQSESNACPHALTREEKKNFKFDCPWDAKILNPGWDELRQQRQDMISIVFHV